MSRCFLSLLLLMVAACGGGDDRGKRRGSWGEASDRKFADWRILVEVAPVSRGHVANELVTHGSLESEAMADITPEAAGVVTEIRAEEGEMVARGQVLAVLSSPSLEAGSERAKVELSQARRRFEQSKVLHGTGAISDSEFLEAQDAFEIAKASFNEARGTRGFTRLTSPIDGTVALRNVRLGELAGSAGPAFQVVDLERLRVIVNMSEGDLIHLKKDQTVTLAGTYDRESRATGSVLRVSPVVDQTTGTIRVTIAVDPMDGDGLQLRPGQFVEVRIEVDRHEDVLTIPRKAVQWLDGSPIAWRVIDRPEGKDDEGKRWGQGKRWGKRDKDEKPFFAKLFADDDKEKKSEDDPWEGVPRRIVERVNLTIGYTDADWAEIEDGLTEGDLVVTVGGDSIRAEAEVKLPGDPNPKKPKDDDDDGYKEGDAPADGESE